MSGIDIEGHLMHVAEVVEAAVREQIAADIHRRVAQYIGSDPIGRNTYAAGWVDGCKRAARIARGAK